MSITAVPLKPVKRRVLVYLWLGIALAVVLAAVLAFQTPIDPATVFLSRNAKAGGIVTTPSGLQYQVLKAGKGPTPTDEDVAVVGYEGKLTDGTVFDQSTPQQPLVAPLGEKATIPGFEEAIKLMPVGSRYRVWIKPSLAYGNAAKPGIPPRSVLVFDLDMIDFKSKQWVREMQARQQMMQQQGMGAPGVPGAMPPGAMPQGAPPSGGAPEGAVPPPPGEGAPVGR